MAARTTRSRRGTSAKDDARSVLSDPRSPPSERFDAQAELQKAHRPAASDLIPPDHLRPIIDHINRSMEQAALAKSQVIPFPGRDKQSSKRGMQSVFVDDMQIFASGEYWEKPSPLGYEAMRQMVDQTPVLSAVVLTRARQVARFCAPSEDGGIGFEVRHTDKGHKPSDAEKGAMKELTTFFQNCGWERNARARKRLRRDNFPTFVSKLVRDSLTMDAAPIETEMMQDRSQGIDGLYAVDGATIRLCTDEGYEGDDAIFALQVVQGRIATPYTYEDLIYEVRNPRTDVRLAGYGLGETELLIRTVTGFLNAMNTNIQGFSDNAIPRGLLQLTGDYSQEDLDAFRRLWNGMVKGTNNAWTLPVLVSKDQEGKASFEKFGVDFDEMMFSKWMTFLTSLICAIYGMSPDEINFESFAASKSSLSGSDTTEKLADSKDKGLRPLMSYLENTLTDFVVSEFNQDWCFRWVGMDPEDADKAWEAKKLVLTVDELRAEKGYPPHPDPQLGAAPLNPALVGPWLQLNHPPPGGDFGGQDDGQDFGGEDPDAGGPDGMPGAPPPPGQDEQPGQGAGFGGAQPGEFGKALSESALTLGAIYSVGGDA